MQDTPGMLLRAALVAVALASVASAQDTILFKDGTISPAEGGTQQLEVLKETYTTIKFDIRANGPKVSQEVSTARVAHVEYGKKVPDYDAALQKFRAGSYDEAIASLEPLVERSTVPWLPQYALYYIAESQYRKGAYEEAIAAFARLEKQVPDSRFIPEARWKVGLAKLATKKYDEARSSLNVLKRDVGVKGFDPVFEYRADLALIAIDEAQGNHEVARAALEKLQSEVGDRFPEVASEIRLRIGGVYVHDKDYRKAEEYFEAILEEGTPDRDVIYGAYLGLGHCYFVQSQFKQALTGGYLRVVVMNDRDGDAPLETLLLATFWAARCFDQLRGENEANERYARGLFDEVIAKAPGSQLAQEARQFRRR